MIDPPENYISQDLSQTFRHQAFRVWAICMAVVFLWVLSIILAPVFRSGELQSFATPLYAFFSYICHQMPERSLHLAGHQFAVCSRCFGVYFGLLAGFLIYPLWRTVDETEPLPRIGLFLSMIPIGVDWSLTMFGIWENTQASRYLTGLILGIACATYIVPAIVEITRNTRIKRVK